MKKPWDDIIPAQDIESFAAGFHPVERALQAGERPALVIVDMTREFVDGAYPTGWSATGYPALKANRTLLEEARRGGIPVFFTKVAAVPGTAWRPAERGRWNMREPARDRSGAPPGDVIMDEIAPLEHEIVLHKGWKPSGFCGTPLASYLIYHGVDTVIVTGMTTSGCVRATVLDAFQNNFSVVIPHECCADRSQISHAVNLFDMHMKYADVVSLGEVLGYLEGLRGGAGNRALAG